VVHSHSVARQELLAIRPDPFYYSRWLVTCYHPLVALRAFTDVPVIYRSNVRAADG
jgi:hypothetical protein